MSVAVLGRCFDTQTEGAAHLCGNLYPSVVHGTKSNGDVVTYTLSCVSVGSGGTTLNMSRTNSADSTPLVSYTATLPAFPDCSGVVTWQDGAAVAWAIVAAWVAAFALLTLRRGL